MLTLFSLLIFRLHEKTFLALADRLRAFDIACSIPFVIYVIFVNTWVVRNYFLIYGYMLSVVVYNQYMTVEM